MSTGEFVQLNKENEHILVCLSSSPSNEKIIRTAAKMARDMRARFTALYVQTGKRERESDKRRLEAHVQFAKESGAEIVMTHGENVGTDRGICTFIKCHKNRDRTKQCKEKSLFQQTDINREVDRGCS